MSDDQDLIEKLEALHERYAATYAAMMVYRTALKVIRAHLRISADLGPIGRAAETALSEGGGNE